MIVYLGIFLFFCHTPRVVFASCLFRVLDRVRPSGSSGYVYAAFLFWFQRHDKNACVRTYVRKWLLRQLEGSKVLALARQLSGELCSGTDLLFTSLYYCNN